jgi:hypothetical protein
MSDYKITDYNYITSSIGNAYFSGLSFDELWNCVSVSKTREELDTAVDITIKLKELTDEK